MSYLIFMFPDPIADNILSGYYKPTIWRRLVHSISLMDLTGTAAVEGVFYLILNAFDMKQLYVNLSMGFLSVDNCKQETCKCKHIIQWLQLPKTDTTANVNKSGLV